MSAVPSLARSDHPSSAGDLLPAAQTLATLIRYRSGREIVLPARFARAAVERFFEVFQAVGDIVEGPDAEVGLRESEWAFRVVSSKWPLGLLPDRHGVHPRMHVYIFQKLHVGLSAASAKRLLQALEHVKPVERDADGLIMPWVPVRHRVEALAGNERDEDDAVHADSTEPPALADEDSELPSFISTEEIRTSFHELAKFAGFPSLPFSVSRGSTNKHGFVTGRVWYGQNFAPRRLHLTTCPNSDRAEILATAVHELAHPISRVRDHSDTFKLAMVSLAERRWGDRWFVEARRRVAESFRVVDSWLAAGIRAALRNAEPPTARSGDDGQMARVVTKIRKLRELAADQLGLPEAITASAAANDLVTTYGLGGYSVRIDAGIDEQMIDRWLEMEDDSVWRRDVGHVVSRHCDVFALHLTSPSRMHLFGRYADIVAAEYLYSISAAQITREADRHIETWKKGRAYTQAGDTRRERTSFCESAAVAFGEKLEMISAEEAELAGRRMGKSEGIAVAEDFAELEHEKRGSGWGSSGGKHRRYNAAGKQAGGSLSVSLGISSGGASRRMLPGRR